MSNYQRSLNLNASIGISVLLILIFALGGWLNSTKISGAVIAHGVVAPLGNAKNIQHLEGGVVKKIFVHEGDFVKKDSVLIKLDDTEPKARLKIIESQLVELLAEQSRLQSERDNKAKVENIKDQFNFLHPDSIKQAISGQKKFLISIRESTNQKKKQLTEQISQTKSGISSIEAKLESTNQQISLIRKEIDILNGLNDKGLTSRSRLVSMQREHALLQGQEGGYKADLARLKTRISEIELKSLEIDEQRRMEVYSELAENRAKIARLYEQLNFEMTRLQRTQIISPVDGYVHELKLHTSDGVATAGKTLMSIIPSKEPIVFRVKVRPLDIDEIYLEQPVKIRLKSLKGFLNSELSGSVKTIGADQIQEVNTRELYFNVDIALNKEDRFEKTRHNLKVGMPADVFITKEERSVLAYLFKPIYDIFNKSMRE